MTQGQYKQEYPHCSQAIQTCQITLSTMAVPKIRSLKCPDIMSEQVEKCSDIMELWCDIDIGRAEVEYINNNIIRETGYNWLLSHTR